MEDYVIHYVSGDRIYTAGLITSEHDSWPLRGKRIGKFTVYIRLTDGEKGGRPWLTSCGTASPGIISN